MNTFLTDYLGLGVPIWMQSRKNLFVFFCFDFIIFIFIKMEYFQKKVNNQSFIITIILSLSWCLISYINGKYSYFRNIENQFIKVFSLLKSNLISIILIYLLDKLIIIYFPSISPFGKNKILILGIVSFFLQYIKLYFYKIRIRKKRLYILGHIDEINYFKNLLKEFSIFKNIEIIPFTEQTSKDLGKKSLLILNDELENKFSYKIINDLNLEKLTPFKWCERYLNRIPIKYLSNEEYKKDDWIIDSDSFQWRLKRFGDVIISFLLIILSIPLLFIFGFLIWFEDKGPIFYHQTRTGLNGKEFRITKLRTMKFKSEEFGAVWASINDERITNIGSFLRRTRIDELPQLTSVFIGEMSLIGPRPERPDIEITLKENIPFYNLRHAIKPGLSGWAQVNYPYGASIKDSEIKLSYELFYIRNQSFLFDFLIFIKTIKLVINMKGSKPIN